MPTYKLKHEATGKVFRISSDTPRDPEEVKQELQGRIRDYFVQQSQTPVPRVPSVAETAIGTADEIVRPVGEMAKGIIKPIYKTFVANPQIALQETAAGLGSMSAGQGFKPTPESREVNVPFLGKMRGVETVPQAVGEAVQTAAIILPASKPLQTLGNVRLGALTGGAYGGGGAMAERKSGPEIALSTAGGAAFGAGLGALARERPPKDLLTKAEKLTTEILQPSKTDVAESLARGKKYPAIEQATKVITKSKNYGELRKNFDKVITDSFNKRNAILKANNYKVKPDYINKLEETIQAAKAGGQRTPQELKQMEDVLNREKTFYSMNRGLDRVGAQSRKEYLQKETRKLLESKNVSEQPARKQAMDTLRRGLKEAVEGNDPEIAQINAAYEGLLDAKNLAAGQEALALKAVPENILGKIVSIITRPRSIPGEIASNAFRVQSNLARKTGQIEKLVRKSGFLPK